MTSSGQSSFKTSYERKATEVIAPNLWYDGIYLTLLFNLTILKQRRLVNLLYLGADSYYYSQKGQGYPHIVVCLCLHRNTWLLTWYSVIINHYKGFHSMPGSWVYNNITSGPLKPTFCVPSTCCWIIHFSVAFLKDPSCPKTFKNVVVK